MRLVKLHLKAFGPFTDRILDFGDASKGLVVVHGANEAGKSSALRAIADLRFGIPLQSKDDFVHLHRNMRVGGEFTDRNGTPYSLMRRKRLVATLSLTDFGREGPGDDRPAPAGIEALLTGGLTKEAYDAMFGLDHQRLRDGGRALLKGEGDVGAALFEASSGVQSIPQILERLDLTARKYFMPGNRGRNARINEALNTYKERHDDFRAALVKPSQWADLFNEHEAAALELTNLDARRTQVNTQLLSVTELRAVAPLLRAFDSASQTLAELAEVVLLSETASAERTAAQTGLTDALHNAHIAATEEADSRATLAGLSFDPKIIAVSAAINRLHASGDTIDQHRRDIASAKADIESATKEVVTLAARISKSSTLGEVLERVPSKVEKASIDQLLLELDVAGQAVDQHRETARQAKDSTEAAADSLPSPEARSMLRIVQAEVSRCDGTLRRLSALPSEIKAARRSVSQALAALGLPDQAALRQVCGLLDAQIDSALQQENANATRRDGLTTRIREISDALATAQSELTGLLDAGAVATPDEVAAARTHRERGWALVRGAYIDRSNPSIDGYGAGQPLPAAYEDAVAQADQLIDALASDTERAAQLQASRRAIETLEHDRSELTEQIATLAHEESARQLAWGVTLDSGNLPSLTPGALRDWQALLPPARAAFENLQAKIDEMDGATEIEQGLATRLRAAVIATALAAPDESAELTTLVATAAEVDATIKTREVATLKSSGKEVERERQRQQSVARETELRQTLKQAGDHLKPTVERLMLQEGSPIPVIRARLGEFSDLADENLQLTTAKNALQRSEKALEVLSESAKTIWEVLEDTEPADLRFYAEQIKERLNAALAVKAAGALAQQAIDAAVKRQGEHSKTAGRHQMTLDSLCAAAQVVAASLLPAAEEQSRRRRGAQQAVDTSRSQLALASNRTRDDLRTALENHAATRIDADEAAAVEELGRLEEKLGASRAREQASRLALDAIDSSDTAVAAREAMESATASVRATMPTWIRSKIAHSLLAESLRRFRDRAQGPMLTAATAYFERMTRGEFVRLLSDDSGKEPVLIAQRNNNARIRVEEMSEGTRDQLFLSLRLAALDIRRASGVDLPVVLDDVLMTSDEDRSAAMLEALADFSKGSQVIMFTHHRHISELAVERVNGERLTVLDLGRM